MDNNNEKKRKNIEKNENNQFVESNKKTKAFHLHDIKRACSANNNWLL